MFKFRFSDQNDDVITKDSKEVTWLESKQIIPIEEMQHLDYGTICNNFNCKNNISIKYISSESTIKSINKTSNENSIIHAEKNNSDLISGLYEGGLKIWECTKDLVDFLSDKHIDLAQKKVLDLGCGVGIVGIFSLLNGAYVYFQDYNVEVITSVTIPNVFSNISSMKDVQTLSKFYTGDWESFQKLIEHDMFDYILTSETIYNIDNYKKLHSVFKRCLKKNGTIYVAAKTYYFGVGGGLRSFEDFVMKEQCFECKSVWKCSDGINREILQINWKST